MCHNLNNKTISYAWFRIYDFVFVFSTECFFIYSNIRHLWFIILLAMQNIRHGANKNHENI